MEKTINYSLTKGFTFNKTAPFSQKKNAVKSLRSFSKNSSKNVFIHNFSLSIEKANKLTYIIASKILSINLFRKFFNFFDEWFGLFGLLVISSPLYVFGWVSFLFFYVFNFHYSYCSTIVLKKILKNA